MADDMGRHSDRNRDFDVKTRLTAEEFVAFHNLCKRLGLDHSSTLRMWIKEHIERHALRNTIRSIGPDRVADGTEDK